MASSNSGETSSKKANENVVNVENFNKPKQATVDESKKTSHSDVRKLEHFPELSRNALCEYELGSDATALSASSESILVYEDSKFLLFNTQLEPLKEIEWKEYDPSGLLTVDDLAYLSCDESYLALTRSSIYRFCTKSFDIKLLDKFSKKDKSGDDNIAFSSITAHDDHIFIAYANASAVSKWTWKPSLQLVNRWTKAKVVEETDHDILSIRTDGTHVALLVRGATTRIEVFDFNLSTRIVHHQDLSATALMLVTLGNNQWLVTDSDQRELILINEDNQIEKRQNKDSAPVNAVRSSDDTLVVKCRKPNKLQVFRLD